ncbi:hypothetical protein [Pontiella sp.]
MKRSKGRDDEEWGPSDYIAKLEGYQKSASSTSGGKRKRRK